MHFLLEIQCCPQTCGLRLPVQLYETLPSGPCLSSPPETPATDCLGLKQGVAEVPSAVLISAPPPAIHFAQVDAPFSSQMGELTHQHQNRLPWL